MKKVRLIDDWKSSWRFASIQWSTVGLVLMVTSDTVVQVFTGLPPEIRDRLPHATTIATVIFAMTLVSRLLQVKEKCKDDDQ